MLRLRSLSDIGCSDAGNDRGNGNPAKRADQGSADAIGATKAQVREPAKECCILIIRRSWVRSPPAPPILTCAYAADASFGLDTSGNENIRWA
jgi:hypothetical protein